MLGRVPYKEACGGTFGPQAWGPQEHLWVFPLHVPLPLRRLAGKPGVFLWCACVVVRPHMWNSLLQEVKSSFSLFVFTSDGKLCFLNKLLILLLLY